MRRLLAVAFVVVILVGTAPVAAGSWAVASGPGVSGSGSDGATGPGIASGAEMPMEAEIATGSEAEIATGAESHSARGLSGPPQTLGAADDFDSVEFHITVYENGTAEWTFTYQRILNNETERQRFERFASEFNNNSTEMYTEFRQQARRLTSAGHNTTDRVMKAESFSKKAYVGGIVSKNRGIVKMSFQWTGFGYSQDDSGNIIIGDVFEGGLYVGPNQSLVVHAGPGLRFESVAPSQSAQPSGESLEASEWVMWEGEQDFVDQRPRVQFDPIKETTTTTTTNGSGNDAPTTGTSVDNATQPPGAGTDWSPLMMFIMAVVVLLSLAAAFAWRQGDFGSFADDTDNPGDGGGGEASTAGDGTTPTATEPSVSDEELLTDEARVKTLLDENGGRMKQVNIVEETGWSKSKVSMLLSEMEENGDISKLRVGRENIISLEGHEPDAAGSPLEGE